MVQLELQPQTEKRLKTILAQYNDLQPFEKKYQQSSKIFYQQFMAGKLDDIEDFIVWAGIYEMLQDNKHQLNAIK